MKQIKIGTCVPGTKAEEWLKGFVGKGFETFSLNFHMSLGGTDLDKLALTTDKLLAGTDSKITTLGYYCNPIQYAEHRKTLEKVICTAEKFGATHVSTFAGAWEGKPVESAYEEFGKVFRELAVTVKVFESKRKIQPLGRSIPLYDLQISPGHSQLFSAI